VRQLLEYSITKNVSHYKDGFENGVHTNQVLMFVRLRDCYGCA